VLDRAVNNDRYAHLAGPDYWNDPDILQVGLGLNDAEGRSQMALWSLMKAPLLIGCDLTTASPATISTLAAEEVIAVNQDALGIQGILRNATDAAQVWAGPLTGGCFAAVLLALLPGAEVRLTWAMLGLPAATTLSVRDVWARRPLGQFAGAFAVKLTVAHDNAMVKLCPVSR